MNKYRNRLPHSNDNPCWIVEDAAWHEDFKVKVWFRDGTIKIDNSYRNRNFYTFGIRRLQAGLEVSFLVFQQIGMS